MARRDVCLSCQTPKGGPVPKPNNPFQIPQATQGRFSSNNDGTIGKRFAQGRQRKQPSDFSRSIWGADPERSVGRFQKFGPPKDRVSASSTEDQKQTPPPSFRGSLNQGRSFQGLEKPDWPGFRGRFDQERLFQEPERKGLFSSGSSQPERFGRYNSRGSTLSNEDREWTESLPFRSRIPRDGPFSDSQRGTRLSPGGNQHHERHETDLAPPAAIHSSHTQQLHQSRENRAHQQGNFDTGNRSGLEDLLKHTAHTKKAAITGVIKSRDRSEISKSSNDLDGIIPEVSMFSAESQLFGGEKEAELFGTRKGRQRGRLQRKQDELPGEEGRRLRGRFQADLEEPQVAEAKVEPRSERKAAHRGSSRRTDYDLEDLDEELPGGRRVRKKKPKDKSRQAVVARTPIQLPEFISVDNLATALRVRTEEFISRMEEMGFERPRYDHVLDAETSGLIASEFNFEPTYSQESRVQDLVARPIPEDVSHLPPRPPIVTIMGHVDHGKTTILDWLRKSSVVESEHGGITQHIGAFSVTMPGGKQITFLDTPGHAAFLDMRRRGANVTDIVILVVAADDGVKPQTVEAIKHATDAKVPIIVAINKVDKEDASVERVKQDLARHGITVEDYGGEVQAIPISGKFGKGMADLEEATVTLSEMLDHRAELDGPVEGWIIESKVTTAGRVATVLVRRGTLRPGDIIVAGKTWARVRTLRNDAGALVDEAAPGTPVQIDGWRGADPIAGWEVLQAENEDHAKDVVELRLEREELTKLAGDAAAINVIRAEEAEARAKTLAWEAEQAWASKRAHRRPKDNAGWVEGKASGGPKQIPFVVKADVSGSVEAVVNSVSAIGNNEIAANVIRSGVGAINESDVQHLASSGEVGYLISFNQPVDASISRLAEAAGVEILDHNIIYKVTDVVKEKLTAELPPAITQRVVGEAEIGKVFEISVKRGKTKIAGCRVSNGIISRDKKIRVLRGNQVLYDGKCAEGIPVLQELMCSTFLGSLNSLKNVKKDVSEMRKGSECGMGFEDWDGFQEGDQVQCYEEQKTKRTL